MTKKDFEAVAAMIRGEYYHAAEDERLTIRRVTIGLCSVFREANPRFDTEKFLDAAYRDGYV